MPISDEEALRLLQDAFRSVEDDYRARGIFQDRFGFVRSPALVVVDFAHGWTTRARRRHPADDRVQHERLHPRDGHRRKELPIPPDHRPRVRRGPLAGRSRVDPVRHPGSVRRCRAAGGGPGLRVKPRCVVSDHESGWLSGPTGITGGEILSITSRRPRKRPQSQEPYPMNKADG
jgi:hypothetical protein